MADKSERNIRAELFVRSLNGGKVLDVTGSLDADDTAYNIVTEVFTRGNCGNFAVAFNIAFPESSIWYAAAARDKADLVTHVVCELDGRLYDITGDVTDLHRWRPVERTVIEEVISQQSRHNVYDNYSFAERGPLV